MISDKIIVLEGGVHRQFHLPLENGNPYSLHWTDAVNVLT